MQKTRKVNRANLETKKLSPVGFNRHGDYRRKSVRLLAQGLFLGIFVVLAIYGIHYVWTGSLAIDQARSEALTELYFEDYLHLPSEITPGRPYGFQFTLHNLEGKDMEYKYAVYVKYNQNKLFIDYGMMFIRSNNYTTTREIFVTKSILPKCIIVVELVNKNQQIDFWTTGKT